MKPAQYWRESKTWSQWLGRVGVVVGSTRVNVAAPTQAGLTPYCYVIVDFEGEKKEFMGAGHEVLQPGDRVECVLRKTELTAAHELIQYGIKVKKLSV